MLWPYYRRLNPMTVAIMSSKNVWKEVECYPSHMLIELVQRCAMTRIVRLPQQTKFDSWRRNKTSASEEKGKIIKNKTPSTASKVMKGCSSACSSIILVSWPFGYKQYLSTNGRGRLWNDLIAVKNQRRKIQQLLLHTASSQSRRMLDDNDETIL